MRTQVRALRVCSPSAVATLVLVLVLTATGCAPRPVTGDPLVVRDDAACPAPPRALPDSLPVTIYLTTGYSPRGDSAEQRVREAVLRAILARFATPTRLFVPSIDAAFSPAPSTELIKPGPIFDGETVLELAPTGRITITRVIPAIDAPDLLPAVGRAVSSADSAELFVETAAALTDTPVVVHLRVFGTGSHLPAPIDSTAPVITVAEQTVALTRAEVPALAVAGAGAPRYPPNQRSAGAWGAVMMQFVVDTRGQADVTSVRVLFSTHADFTRSVLDALPRMRYIPARVSGCAIAGWVRQRFEFRLER